MPMNTQEEFLKKYAAYLEDLRVLPVKSEEWRDYCYKQKKGDTDDLTMDLLEVLNPRLYRKLFGGGSETSTLNGRDLDPLHDAIMLTLAEYTGFTSKGEELSFFAMLNTFYNQGKSSARREEAFGKSSWGFFTMPISMKKKLASLENFYKEYCKKNPYAEAQDFIQEAELWGADISKNVKGIWLEYHSAPRISIDQGCDESDGTDIEDNKADTEEILIKSYADDDIKQAFPAALGELGKTLLDKPERDFNKIFITRLIMVLMKLRRIRRGGRAERGKEENNLPEEFRNSGEYAYYRFMETPAGNIEYYEALSTLGEETVDDLLHEGYIERAIVDEYGNLWDLYNSLLRDDFKFTDSIIAEIKGVNNMAVKRHRDKYLKMISIIGKELKEKLKEKG